jgi:molybdopterin converting factor subunit 1
MEVEVRLFAMLRERAGRDSVTVDVPDDATVAQAVDAVGRTHGLGDLIAAMPVVMAVNREYASAGDPLSAGDELALIPPVSGGAETNVEIPGGDDAEANVEIPGGGEAEVNASTFSTGEGYEDFMELVGNHVPKPPAYAELLGARPLHAEPGHVRFEFHASELFLNPAGAIQGGFLTVMLDETMGPAALSALGPGFTVPTLELKVSFLRPGRVGRLVADARVVHLGRSVAFLEASLSDDDGNLIATSTATARVVRLKEE